jgi:hypothetical protein
MQWLHKFLNGGQLRPKLYYSSCINIYLDNSFPSPLKLSRYVLDTTLYVKRGRVGRVHMVVDLQLSVQSVPITTKIVSANPAYG